jgi:hypothetical protein
VRRGSTLALANSTSKREQSSSEDDDNVSLTTNVRTERTRRFMAPSPLDYEPREKRISGGIKSPGDQQMNARRA